MQQHENVSLINTFSIVILTIHSFDNNSFVRNEIERLLKNFLLVIISEIIHIVTATLIK